MEPVAHAPSRQVKIVAYALCVALGFGLAEAVLAFLPKVAGEIRGVIYLPPEVTRAAFENYLAIRDPIVGWPSPGRPDVTTGIATAWASSVAPRPASANPVSGEPCVALYGDSFVYGNDVNDDDAWGNVLAGRLACRVDNFGVGGYGTDQALLRFKANLNDRAPVTVLGIFADNLMRNVNQYRDFLTGGHTPFALKPRFVLDDGALKLVPIPDLSYEKFLDGLRRPESLWQHETFLPDSRDGPVSWSFPYTASALRFATKERVAKFMQRKPSWIDFYRPDHDSRALPTTIAIVEEFERVARQRGKSVLVILFPGRQDYEHARRSGTSPFTSLTAGLTALSIPVRDLTADFSAHLGDRNFCEILAWPRQCLGHYGPEGNRLVAKAVHEQLAAGGPLR